MRASAPARRLAAGAQGLQAGAPAPRICSADSRSSAEALGTDARTALAAAFWSESSPSLHRKRAGTLSPARSSRLLAVRRGAAARAGTYRLGLEGMRLRRIRATFAPFARRHAPGRGLQRCSRLRQHQTRLVSSHAPVRALVPPRILRGCGVSARRQAAQGPSQRLARSFEPPCHSRAAPPSTGGARAGHGRAEPQRGCRAAGAHVFRRRRVEARPGPLSQSFQRLLPRRIHHQHGIACEPAADHGPGGLPSGAPQAQVRSERRVSQCAGYADAQRLPARTAGAAYRLERAAARTEAGGASC